MKTLYLIDANSIAHWKYHSTVNGPDSESMEDGILDWIFSFKRYLNPEMALACLDCSRSSNWRKKLFDGYKSGRDSKPKDEFLSKKLRNVPDVFHSTGINTLLVDGFEADDVMASISCMYDGEVVIVSTDKDMHQLVDDRVVCYDPRPNRNGVCSIYYAEDVARKHGVDPTRLRELLAIAGDQADSIPGVSGWGPTFAKLAINQTKSRLELIRRIGECSLDGISEKRQKSFKEQIDMFNLSYELVGLRFDAPIPGSIDMRINGGSCAGNETL